jgi:hypothetical protein
MGHSLGLHFDANFWDLEREEELTDLVECEATWLESLLGSRPEALSFHNPSSMHLTWNADTYAGLRNCYSKRLMDGVPYISDSNGFWRFRRLFDVLSEATEPCLQVLTHPGWWQKEAMPPRARVFRAAFGRASATMGEYDSLLASMKRENEDDTPEEIHSLNSLRSDRKELHDYLWTKGLYSILFLELWIQHESQLIELCSALLRKQWLVPVKEMDAFFAATDVSLDGSQLFELAFGHSWHSLLMNEHGAFQHWLLIRNQILQGRSSTPRSELRNGCVYVAGVIHNLAKWGLNQPFKHDGLRRTDNPEVKITVGLEGNPIELPSIGLTKNAKHQHAPSSHQEDWERLQDKLRKSNL